MLLQNWAYSRVPLYIQRLLDEIIGRNLDQRSMEKLLANGTTYISSPTLS